MEILTTGLLNLPYWSLILLTLLATHLTIVSVTVFLHRHQAHRSLDLHPLVSHFFRFWLWLTTGMVTRQWVAIHRKHHAKCETEEDPHSPQIKGLKAVFFKGSELYRAEAKNHLTLEKYGQGTPDDFIERHLYSRYPYLGIILLLILNIALFGVIGITIFAIQMLWIPLWAAGVINGVGHYWGYRNFETTDAATNIFPWGILVGGEELHNNHHAYAYSARLSIKAWEFDIGWFYIRLMAFFRLAKVRRIAPIIKYDASNKAMNTDTLHAIIRNRAHLMKLYGNRVIKPAIRMEQRGAKKDIRKLYQRACRLMIREDLKLSGNNQLLLSRAISQSATLQAVNEYKQQLKELWARTPSGPNNKLEKIQQWCYQAEHSGIEVLREFALSLQGYSLKKADLV